MAEMTPADVMALTDRNNDNFLNGGGFWYIIVLFFLFGMFGNGFGGYGNAAAQGALTRAEMSDGFNTAEIQRNQADIKADIAGLGREVMENRYAAALQAQTAQAQQAQCCCDLKTAIHAEGEATRALIQQQTIDDLKYQLTQAQTAVSNAVQTQNILGSLGRFVINPPVNPFTCYNGYNGYNTGCGCGGLA